MGQQSDDPELALVSSRLPQYFATVHIEQVAFDPCHNLPGYTIPEARVEHPTDLLVDEPVHLVTS